MPKLTSRENPPGRDRDDKCELEDHDIELTAEVIRELTKRGRRP